MAADDVDMADAGRAGAAPTAQIVLEVITSGNISSLPSLAPSPTSQTDLHTTGDVAENDAERDLLAPFLPLITRIHHGTRFRSASDSASPSFASILRGYDQVNELSEYTVVLQHLRPHDLETFSQSEPADPTPLYRQFEASGFRDRACIILNLVLAFADQKLTKESLQDNELVRNDIYKPHLVAIFVNALAADSLIALGLTIQKIIKFCLVIPLGAEIVEAIVRNDPSTFTDVVELTVQSIKAVSPSAGPADASTALSASSSLLPFEVRQALAICSALATLAPSFATQVALRLREASTTSTAAVYICFQLLVDVPSLRADYATFVYQWMKRAAFKTTTKATPLSTFLQLSLGREGGDVAMADSNDKASSFQEEARYVMSQFRQFLIEDIVQFTLPSDSHNEGTTSRYTLANRLNVLIGFLVIGQLHPEDHETTQLLRMFDKVTKDIQRVQPTSKASKYERVISLMYVLLLLLCAPSAPAFAKMPSQREDSTKLILQLAQQSVFSLYNTKAACPLFILSSVLLYTKSPSLLPFLNSVLDETFPLLAPNHVRIEHLYGVGDAVLKPILTENVMAREVLTAFEPMDKLSALDHDAMDEMALRSLHGLLTEKSFLRHQHARKLEEWMTSQLDRVSTPVHPLLVSILLEWIENYVMAFEYPVMQRPLLQLAIIPLSPAYVARTLNVAALRKPFHPSQGREWARAALVLIYALQFNQRLRQGSATVGTKLYAFANQGNDPSTDQTAQPPMRSSADIVLAYDLAAFPLKNIASQVARLGQLGQAFEFAAPTLQRLVAEEFPQLIASDCTAVARLAPRLSRISGVKHKLSLSLEASNDDSLPRVSWLSACAWLQEIALATPSQVEEAANTAVKSLLPLAILSIEGHEADVEEFGTPEAFIAAFVKLFEERVRLDHSDLSRFHTQLAEALSLPHLVWRQFQISQQQKQMISKSTATSTSSRTWIPREQLIEQPFFVLRNSYQNALKSSSVLRLSLLVLKRSREESVFVLRQRELTAAIGKRAAQANDGSATPVAPSISTRPTADPATQQFLLVQDSIIIQTLLGLVLEAKATTDEATADERVFLLYHAMDEVLAETAKTSPPVLAMSILTQGFDPSLVPSCVHQVSSLKHVWAFWMQPPPVETGSHKSANDRRGGGGNSANPVSKALLEFLGDTTAEKDLAKWQFRVRVFFALCAKYFVAADHLTVVTLTIKQILNRLRGIAVNAPGSTSKGVARTLNISDAARVVLVEAMLTDAVDGCGRHPELRSEVTQFLLNLKKHVGSSHSHQQHVASSPSGVDHHHSISSTPVRAAKPGLNTNHDLDRVVFHAYQRILDGV